MTDRHIFKLCLLPVRLWYKYEIPMTQFKTKSNNIVTWKPQKRSNKARTLTRCMKELCNVLENGSSVIEVKEKMSAVKYTSEKLGDLQDNLMGLIEEEDVETGAQNIAWYDNYDEKDNQSIARAREYIQHRVTRTKNEFPVKLTKLTVPVFESDHKKYLRWKETFERYTNSLTDDVKSDYFLSCTKGKSNELV